MHPGANVHMGRDHTIHALVAGHVKFERRYVDKRQFVGVVPLVEEAAEAAPEEADAAAAPGGIGGHGMRVEA